MEEKIFTKGIKFKCQGSSKCCISRGNHGYVYLTDNDVKKISQQLKVSVKIFKKNYCEYTDNYLHLKEINKNGNCQFLNDKKCSIYNVRPMQCRTWPFWNENMNAKSWNENVVNFCPGIGKGNIVNFEKIKKIIELDLKEEKKIVKI
tara:strand:+ start:155 stop:595 length:441 start_codon:yes stop_codon:yes gene_type:complete